jgi:hypothetical protein
MAEVAAAPSVIKRGPVTLSFDMCRRLHFAYNVHLRADKGANNFRASRPSRRHRRLMGYSMVLQEFVSAPSADISNEAIRFAVVIGGLIVRAMVSREFLQDHFASGPSPSDWIAAYESHGNEIHQIVSAKYLREGISPVLIHTEDF